MVWNLFPLKGDFSFGKSLKSQDAKSRLQGGWVTWVIWCFPKNSAWDVTQEYCCHEAANHQLPIAAAFLIIWMVSVKGCSSLMQNVMQIHCTTHSFILNATATQCTCSLNCVYHPYWLAQWSHHCSLMHIPVHSPWLPDYIGVAQTILILIMAWLFPDRLCIYKVKELNWFNVHILLNLFHGSTIMHRIWFLLSLIL